MNRSGKKVDSLRSRSPAAGMSWVVVLALLAGLAAGGCVFLPHSRRPVMVATEAQPPGEVGPVDPVGAGPPEIQAPGSTRATRAERSADVVRPSRSGSRPPAGHPPEAPSGGVAGVTPESLSTAPPAVSIELSEAEKARLNRSAREDLSQAMLLAEQAGSRALSPEASMDLRAAQGLMQAASAALQRGELPAAAALAHKARLLLARL